MLQLARKDIHLQKYTMLIMLSMLIFYLTTGSSIIYVSILFCIALIMNAFAADEKSSINLLLNALPYTRKEIVSSKYISACFFTAIVLVTIIAGNWIFHREMIPWEQIVFILTIVTVFLSFAFPLSYILGSQYLLFTSLAMFVVYLFLVNQFFHDMNDRLRSLIQSILSNDQPQIYVFVLLLIGILYALSWLLSMRIYSRKVF